MNKDTSEPTCLNTKGTQSPLTCIKKQRKMCKRTVEMNVTSVMKHCETFLSEKCCSLFALFITQLSLVSHSFPPLCLCVEQHCLPSQPSFHPSLRYNILASIISSLWIHHPQLPVALCQAVQTPQLVAQAFTLLRQDVNLLSCCTTNWARTTAVGNEREPGQSGVGPSVVFAHATLLHTEENTWSE